MHHPGTDAKVVAGAGNLKSVKPVLNPCPTSMCVQILQGKSCQAGAGAVAGNNGWETSAERRPQKGFIQTEKGKGKEWRRGGDTRQPTRWNDDNPPLICLSRRLRQGRKGYCLGLCFCSWSWSWVEFELDMANAAWCWSCFACWDKFLPSRTKNSRKSICSIKTKNFAGAVREKGCLSLAQKMA